MPELPEVELVRRALEPVLTGARFDAVVLRRKNLRIPFPRRFVDRLVGTTITAVTRRAKYLLATLSSGETLLIHLGMTGGFRVAHARIDGGYRSEEASDDEKHDHVVFTMSTGAVVTFNDARRFGLMDLVRRNRLAAHPVVGRLGPEPLSPDFDAAALARACRKRSVPLKLALLDQRVVAGVGNIYASEALWVAGLSPTAHGLDDHDRSGPPSPYGGAPGRGHRGGARGGHCRHRTALSRLRSGRWALSAPHLRRHHQAHRAGRARHVLLPGVPALAVAEGAGAQTATASGTRTTL